jgi:hypothetical protein
MSENNRVIVKRQGSFLVVVQGTEKGKILSCSSKQEKHEGQLTNYREKDTDKVSQCSIINLLLKEGKTIEETAKFLVLGHLFPNKKSYEKRVAEGLIELTETGYTIKNQRSQEKLIMLAKQRILTHLHMQKNYLSYRGDIKKAEKQATA